MTVQRYFDHRAQNYYAHVYLSERQNCHTHNQQVRRQFFRALIRDHGKVQTGMALDIGSGPGTIAQELKRLGFNTFAIDLSAQMLLNNHENRGEGAKLSQCSADLLCYKDNSFDIVTAAGVLEYIQDDERALREILRVLKPGGSLIISAPVGEARILSFARKRLGQLLFRKERPSFYHKSYTPRRFLDKLTGVGFTIKTTISHQFTFFPYDYLFPKLSARLDAFLTGLFKDKPFFRNFGKTYIVSATKPELGQSPPPKSPRPQKIGHIVSRFPKLTETFVLYDVLEMERQGAQGEIYPLLREHEPVTHPEVERLVRRAHYHPFISLPILYAQLYFLRRRPLAYLKVWAEVLKGTFGSANFFFGALGIFPKSVRFAYEMEKEGITHVHAHFANHPAVAALIINRLTGIPFSFTARGSDIHVDRRMLKEKLQAAAFAISVSAFNKKLMADECGAELGDKIHVVHDGIDTDFFSPQAKNNGARPFQILCIGRFEEVKGHAYLVEACRLLRDRGLNFECNLIGDGELRPKVEKQIKAANLEDRVKLLGHRSRPEVLERLAQADVVVLATVLASSGKCEGIPNVLKEAMACGLPVVGSAISGMPELVDHGESGFLLPPKDTVALADALQRLSEDPELRHRLGQVGRVKVVREFNLQQCTASRTRLFLNGHTNGTTPKIEVVDHEFSS